MREGKRGGDKPCLCYDYVVNWSVFATEARESDSNYHCARIFEGDGMLMRKGGGWCCGLDFF